MDVGRFADTLCENRSMKRKATKEGGRALMLFSFSSPLPLLFSYPPFFLRNCVPSPRKRGEGGG